MPSASADKRTGINTAPLKETLEWAGHSCFSTTADTYAHVLAGSKNRLAQSIDSALLEPIGQEAVRKCLTQARDRKKKTPKTPCFRGFPLVEHTGLEPVISTLPV